MPKIRVTHHLLKENGTFPNNGKLPLIVYRNVITDFDHDIAAKFEKVFRNNNWGSFWRNGVYDYHHYHSTAHEVLGIYQGKVKLQLGGPNGYVTEVQKGDAVIIPAGVAHKNLGESDGFACVGGYPRGQDYDMKYGKDGERPEADNNIEKVSKPENDPIFGKRGGINELWYI